MMKTIATLSLAASTITSLAFPMDDSANKDPSGEVGEMSGQAKDSKVELQQSTTQAVPVPNRNTPAETGGTTSDSNSGVSVAAADPKASRAGGRWNCWVEEISDLDKKGHCALVADDTPAAAAPAAPAPAPIVLTSHDVATLIVDGSGVFIQPPTGTILLHMPLIAYTNPTTRTLTTSVGGTAVDVEVTPATYTWNWGDGTTLSTTDAGQPYPNQTVTHLYAATADNVTVSLTTTWTARFKPSGATDWQPVDGYVTTTQTAPTFNIRRLVPYLSDDAEEHQGH